MVLVVEMTAVVKRFCIKCGKDQQVDGETLRCLTCGMQTKYMSAPAPATTTPSGQPSPTGVVLPSTARSRQWVEHTQGLADSFAKAAREVEARAVAATAEAERLRRASNAFLGLLKQVELEEASVKTGLRRTAGRWARKFDACIQCGTVDKRHRAKGLCMACYDSAAKRAGRSAA